MTVNQQGQQVVQQPQQAQPQITSMDGYYAYLGNQQTQYAQPQQPVQQGQPIVMQQPQQVPQQMQQQAPIYVPVNSNTVQAQPQGNNFTAPAATPAVASNQQNVQNIDNFKSEMKTALGGIFDMMTGNNNNGQQQQPMMQQVPMAPQQQEGWLEGTSGNVIKIGGGFAAGYGVSKLLSNNGAAETAINAMGRAAVEISKNGGTVAQLVSSGIKGLAKFIKF